LNGQISQDVINAIFWRACDTFRGTVDPAKYKNYTLVMLFVKYISDAWRDHYDAYRAQLGDDETRIRRRMGFEKFKLPEGADFPALYAQRNAPNLGEVINIALEAIENANKEKLEGDALMRLNVVVANFPFSRDKWGAKGAVKDRYRRFWRGIPPKSAGDYAFITHMIETTYTDPAQNGGVTSTSKPATPPIR
jgi:type I restriction-modification system DNA methylase subunit